MLKTVPVVATPPTQPADWPVAGRNSQVRRCYCCVRALTSLVSCTCNHVFENYAARNQHKHLTSLSPVRVRGRGPHYKPKWARQNCAEGFQSGNRRKLQSQHATIFDTSTILWKNCQSQCSDGRPRFSGGYTKIRFPIR